MKYTKSNPPMQCFMRQSTWYKGAGTVPVRGVLWHSTGANNPNLKRYVQPDDTATDRAELLKLLGTNTGRNDWNHIEHQAGVHAWIGKLASGEVTTVQAGPWDKKAWGCASGAKGSCNNGWIQFEICEDALNDRTYFDKVYKEAVELTAYLCQLYNLNPQGTVTYNGVKVPVILCHQDSYQLGLGSNHGDVLHWFPKFGKSMQTVRDDVSALLAETNNKKEEPEVTYEQWKAFMTQYRKELQDNDCGEWSKAAREWCIQQGIFAGGGNGPDGLPNYMWQDLLTREQAAALFYRYAQLAGLTQ
ncbi:MAG: peptidoglycan recognition protein family protein [Ruminococcus flavefaciens]|nr:peptidoglycan recognition protein family protein [Ruminococcus flavefaciens]